MFQPSLIISMSFIFNYLSQTVHATTNHGIESGRSILNKIIIQNGKLLLQPKVIQCLKSHVSNNHH
jgi:hypothetical protein